MSGAAGEPDQPELNEAQKRVIDLLGAPESARPVFDAGLGQSIIGELSSRLEAAAKLLPPEDRKLYVTKRQLGMIHGCESQFVADRNVRFEWSTSTARGTVAHRAVELLVGWRGAPVANLLVDEAIASCTEGSDSLGLWLQGLGAAHMADLRNSCNDLIGKFLESFPTLDRRWAPRAESSIRVEAGSIVFAGRVDLILGRTVGQTAGKVFIDLKTGAPHGSHMDDLRFYALLETIRTGVPPRQLASYYLDQARAVAEPVTEALLRSALHRTIDGTTLIIELLHGGRAPTVSPGPSCAWCPLVDECRSGREYLDSDSGDDLG